MKVVERKGLLQGQVFGLALAYSENLFRMIYGVAVLLFARKLLTVDDFSNFAFYLSLAVLLYGFSKFSLDAYSIRTLVRHPEVSSSLVLKLILFRAVGSIAFLLLFLLGLFITGKFSLGFFFLLVFQLVRPLDSIEWLLRSTERIAYQSLCRIASMAVVISILVAVYLFGFDLEPINLAFVVGFEWVVLAILYMYWYFFLYPKRRTWVGDGTKYLKSIVKGTFPSYVAFILFLAYSKFDQLVLKGCIDSVEYGNYMIAARLNESAVIIVVSLNMVLYPRLVQQHLSSMSKFSADVRRGSALFLFLGICVVGAVLGGRTLYPVLPEVFQRWLPFQVLKYLSLMIFSVLPVFFFGLRSSYFTIIDKPMHILWGGFLGLASMIILGVPLMRSMGGDGGALALIVSTIVALFISNFINRDGRLYLKIVFPFFKQ